MMNNTSKLYKPLEKDEMDRIISFHFEKDTEYQAQLLSGGMFNTTYRISFVRTNKKIILRTGPVNTCLLLLFEHNLMKAEEYVYKLMADKKIPCSDVLVTDMSKTLIDRNYMIIDHIDGIPLSDKGISIESKQSVYMSIGQYIEKMHKITDTSFGRVSEMLEGKRYESWSEFIMADVSVVCEKLRVHSVITATEEDSIKSAVFKYTELLDEIKTPCLVHGDLWEGNILVKKNRNFYDVGAVIDADRAVFGDPDFEFASPWMINEWFIKGYGNVPKGYKSDLRKKIYRLLYSLIDTYVWEVEYCNHEKSEKNRHIALDIASTLG